MTKWFIRACSVLSFGVVLIVAAKLLEAHYTFTSFIFLAGWNAALFDRWVVEKLETLV